MEKFGEDLLDDMINVTADIRSSNRRLSARLEEAINSSASNSSAILRPSVLNGGLLARQQTQTTVAVSYTHLTLPTIYSV